MVIITGAYGFIGSCLVHHLLHSSSVKILAVDDFTQLYKSANLPDHPRLTRVQRMDLWSYLTESSGQIDYFIHLGARTDTTEKNEGIFERLNLDYSKAVWQYCAQHQIPLIYASSAATYGDGSFGFVDNHALVPRLVPMNAYGWSKQEFDMWALAKTDKPPAWYGLKFFNVYGPNEYHKDRMASVILHTYRQILQSGEMKLFKSHREEIADGEQKRDFIYVKDVITVLDWFMHQAPESGLYNVGTGKARSFRALAEAVFEAMNLAPRISYIDTPEDIRHNYQYLTEANLEKIGSAGFHCTFYSLEKGIEDYIKAYLTKNKMFHHNLDS